ncbi:hypothetical protein ACFOGJ_09100 [Marinibaculum pumilum]|uniref:Flagellar protein n=1 Tax=Marinibaculum pumilum TaxID=1766165 RepID=A0ABV7KZ00_9PROT
MIGLEDGLRYVLGLLAVLGLIFLAARAYRSLNERGLPGGAKRHRRLGIEEFIPLDARRRLVLLRHDEQEYLVLLGQQSETLLNVSPRGAATDRAAPQDAARPVPATVLDLLRHLRGARPPAGRPSHDAPEGSGVGDGPDREDGPDAPPATAGDEMVDAEGRDRRNMGT